VEVNPKTEQRFKLHFQNAMWKQSLRQDNALSQTGQSGNVSLDITQSFKFYSPVV